jgi:hypothetical protein
MVYVIDKTEYTEREKRMAKRLDDYVNAIEKMREEIEQLRNENKNLNELIKVFNVLKK